MNQDQNISSPACNERPLHRMSPARGVLPTFDATTLLWCTVCVADRRSPWCAHGEVQAILHELWQSPSNAWKVGDYLLMPDHLHFFCAPSLAPVAEVEAWVAYWKSAFSKRIGRPEWRWQRGVFHHRIRSEQQYVEKGLYMAQNPVRKGLVQDAEEWSWRGRVHPIRW